MCAELYVPARLLLHSPGNGSQENLHISPPSSGSGRYVCKLLCIEREQYVLPLTLMHVSSVPSQGPSERLV